MSPPRQAHLVRAARFPRVSGDEPETFKQVALALVFSPRERG